MKSPVFALLRTGADSLRLVLPDSDAAELGETLRRFVFRRKVVVAVRADLHVAAEFAVPVTAAGTMLAGTEESPGEIELYQGRSYKSYRGMGSVGAMVQGSADRYFQGGVKQTNKLVPEGIEGRVPYKGSVVAILFQQAGGLRASMGYCGCATIDDMRNQAEFVQITSAGIRESHVHDVQITKEAPNYRAD